MMSFRLLLLALVLFYSGDFVHGRSRRPSRDECKRDRDCNRGEVCTSGGRRGRKECARPPRVYCGSYTCPDRYVFSHDSDDIECEDGVCDYTVCCEPVVYCDSHRCSDSYELLHDCEYVECEDRICDDSQCCMHVPVTNCIEDLLAVTLPDIPLSLQFGLLVDLSGGSMADVHWIKGVALDFLDGLLYTDTTVERDLRLALGSFVDIPEPPFGEAGEYAYREEKDFGTCHVGDATCAESDRDAWTTALYGLHVLGGGDGPGSQSIALMSAIDEWDWATGYTKLLAITTDSVFHTPGDDERYFSVGETVAAANAKDIKIIVIKTHDDPGPEMYELAIGTGGSVQTIMNTRPDFVGAFIEGIEESTYSIVEVTSSCDSPWTVVSGPPATDVSGGNTVEISNEVCALDDTDSTCDVEMVGDGATLETFTFAVVDGMVVLT